MGVDLDPGDELGDGAPDQRPDAGKLRHGEARRATAELERATGRADRLEREAFTRRPRVA